VMALKKGDLWTHLNNRDNLKFIIIFDGSDHKAKETEHNHPYEGMFAFGNDLLYCPFVVWFSVQIIL
jgi:hypothetical protein